MILMRKVRHLLEYVGVLVIIFVVRSIPKSLRPVVGKGLGALYFLFPKHRKRTTENLSASFSDASKEEIVRIAKGVYSNLGLNLIEFIEIDRLSRKEVEDRVEIVGIENLIGAISENRGVVMVTSHIGNWELAGRALTYRGFCLNVVARKQKNGLVEKLIRERREKAGLKVIYSDSAKTEVLKALSKGEIVVILADQDAGKRGVFVKFFKRPASTTPSPILFALRKKVLLIPFYDIRIDQRRHRVVIEPPFCLVNTGNLKRDVEENLLRLSNLFEAVIKEHPEQWFWLHNRWATKM
jgi:KDO2-lipid IV(A) lauroyltransferase